jgi:hypothetical protein
VQSHTQLARVPPLPRWMAPDRAVEASARDRLARSATQCCRLTELEKQIETGQAELQINQGALDDLRVRVLLFALVGPAPRTSGATTAAGLCSNDAVCRRASRATATRRPKRH